MFFSFWCGGSARHCAASASAGTVWTIRLQIGAAGFGAPSKSRGGKMNSRTSKLTTLLSSASFLTLVNAMSAQAQQVAQAELAQAAPMEVPEQGLITGSLIHGTAAVGVPVTNLSTQDFAQTGAVTTSELFRSVPAANVTPGPVGTLANNNIGKQTRVNIRNLDPNDGLRSLLMVDGYRFPPQGEADCTIDPSIIPAIPLDRIDILVHSAPPPYASTPTATPLNFS